MRNAVEDVMKNGHRLLKGQCSSCGENISKIVRSNPVFLTGEACRLSGGASRYARPLS